MARYRPSLVECCASLPRTTPRDSLPPNFRVYSNCRCPYPGVLPEALRELVGRGYEGAVYVEAAHAQRARELVRRKGVQHLVLRPVEPSMVHSLLFRRWMGLMWTGGFRLWIRSLYA